MKFTPFLYSVTEALKCLAFSYFIIDCETDMQFGTLEFALCSIVAKESKNRPLPKYPKATKDIRSFMNERKNFIDPRFCALRLRKKVPMHRDITVLEVSIAEIT